MDRKVSTFLSTSFFHSTKSKIYKEQLHTSTLSGPWNIFSHAYLIAQIFAPGMFRLMTFYSMNISSHDMLPLAEEKLQNFLGNFA
jgi:hypothetical protein